ncbi:MAG: hypothetical protein OEW99_09400 [Gammaproteobacteria bacterium]|nr:hypothetical protein [Gammaproteobacteria bacterium]MDH5661270.1 hypothetical protein [Gammaproteobacteria bacterium]
MKHLKIIFALVITLVFTNIVIAGNQRTMANADVNIEVRSVEDIVNNSDDFVSINPGDNAAKMSSTSLRIKNKTVSAQTTGLVQLQSNNKDVVKKYNRFSNKQGEKKNKKNR